MQHIPCIEYSLTMTLVLYVCGEPEVTYMSDEETPMLMYLNAHMAVDQMRTKNEAEGKIGAKVPTRRTVDSEISLLDNFHC